MDIIDICLQQQSFKEDGQQALQAFHQWIQGGAAGASGWTLEEENHEGWRVSVEEGDGKQGWLLLRASLHDPLLVLNVESDIPKGELAVSVSRYVKVFESTKLKRV